MFNFKTLKCSNCNSVIANLPEIEVRKLNGSTFLCGCCFNLNLLNNYKLEKYIKKDLNKTNSYYSYYEEIEEAV